MIKEFDKVRLRTGEIARVVEVFSDSVFLAEVATKMGNIEITEIYIDQIVTVFEEIEKPFVIAQMVGAGIARPMSVGTIILGWTVSSVGLGRAMPAPTRLWVANCGYCV